MPVVGERVTCLIEPLLASFHARIGTECDGLSHPIIGFLDARCLIRIC